MRRSALALALLASLAVATSASAADIQLFSDDPAGTGLFDATPVAPVGGNPGTTLGAQRAFVYFFAAERWGQTIDSAVPIRVLARFRPLACTATAGTLGSAGAPFAVFNFPGAAAPDTLYQPALADAIAGVDLQPAQPFDITSNFNSSIDNPATEATCLTGRDWYYGIDHETGGDFDFLNVVAHELAHGLGFANFVNEVTGANLAGFTDIYSLFTLDTTTGLTWNQMTNAQRAASAANNGKVVWNGAAATAAASSVLGPRPSVVVLQGQAAGSHEAIPASFGPAIGGDGGTTGLVRVADDGVGVPADACEPLVNNKGAQNLNGKIALIDRGACTFNVKVANAQAAGAKGVVIADNLPGGSFPGMGGVDPTITIPSMGITFELGQELRASTPVVKLVLDAGVQAGTEAGFVRLYAPTVVALGSSISHWDTTASPNLLMEPFITNTLRAADTFDLTPALFDDIGWTILP
jgi:hypothetical protein